ncbi:MAG: hypothetical protein HFI10_08630 [Lachnospiraceae bacterium]|jgi:hypothetical protein|nr:hypothetical protein [Lachnospiraceae bacterium]
MAKKSWSVTTDEGTFSVDLKGSKVSINGGAPERLNRFAKKTHFLDTEYTIPLGNRTATLFVQSMTSPVLAYNGTDCATGQPWEYQKIPAWGWIFIVLDFASILMGVGWLWALLAVIVTGVAIRSKMNTALKVIISAVLTLILVGLGVMGIMLVAATM